MLRTVRAAFLTGNARERDWMQILDPTDSELEEAAGILGIPEQFLRRRLEDRPARPFVRERGFLAFQFTVPQNHDPRSGTFDLAALTVILAPGFIVTLSAEPVELLLEQIFLPEAPRMRWELLLKLINEISRRYVRVARDMGQALASVEEALRGAQRVHVLYRALDINDRLLDLDLRLLQLAHILEEMEPWLPRDSLTFREYHEDIRIEIRQAREQVDMEQETINTLLDAYTYVVNNNVNHVFKFMAALIILATIPLFIPGAVAMNVPLGFFPHWKYGFAAVTGGLLAVEAVTAAVFFRIGWLRLR